MQASTAPAQATVVGDLGVLMQHLITATGGDFLQAVEDLGLSLSQIKSLHTLSDAEEPISLKALSDRLGLSLPAVSRAVEGLVKRALVSRAEDPTDRRSKQVVLTAKGRRTFEKLFALRVAGLRQFVDGLEPEEREALAGAIRPIARRLAR